MKMEIVQIHENGKQDAEYVEIKVLQACDLKYYILTDTTFTSETSISNKLRHMYWFSTKQVSKDDYVFLRTGSGTNTTHANRAGTTTHVFYWGLERPVWNNTGDGAVLLELDTWKARKV